jgi:hypothetical protein
MTRIAATFSTLALLLAACNSGGTVPPTATPPGATSSPGSSAGPGAIAHPTGADDLVLRMEIGGGLVAPGWILSQLPLVSVYGDGRVITQGPQIEIYPGPALPNLLVSRVSEDGLQQILAAARDAGLVGPDASYRTRGSRTRHDDVRRERRRATHTVSAMRSDSARTLPSSPGRGCAR